MYEFRLHYSEAKWGDEDLEWIVISACSVLYHYGVALRWGEVFDDLHGMLGFHTDMPDVPNLGRLLAYYLTDGGPLPFIDAWNRATRDAIGDPLVYAAIYRSAIYDVEFGFYVVDYGYEYLPGYGTGMEEDPSYWTSLWPTYVVHRVYDKWPCG